LETLARATQSLFVDGTRRKRNDCTWNLWSDHSHIIHDATVLPGGSLEPDKGNLWYANSLEVEKEVCRRLHGVKDFGDCLNILENGLELQYCRNVDLEDYIRANSPPPWNQRMDWILQLVDFMAAFHNRKVLGFGVALRKILLADDWTIRVTVCLSRRDES
jgi:hypothetical protein